MTKRTQLYLIVVTLLVFLLVLIFTSNFYFIRRLATEQQHRQQVDHQQLSRGEIPLNGSSGSSGSLAKLVKVGSIRDAVESRMVSLKTVFKNKNPRYYPVKRGLLRSFEPRPFNISTVWKIANSWPSANEIYPQKDEKIGKVIQALQELPILRARNTPRGTQLKLVFDLAGKQSVLFKPSWYSRNVTIEGPVYSGKDRHNSEVVAFHLAAILNLRWTPVVVGRRVSLTEIYQLADAELKETMTKNDTHQCVYGKCYYCKESEAVCDSPETGSLEGALLLLIPGKFAKYRSPWQRTYQAGATAEWERNESGYCAQIRDKLPLERLLDLIDAAVFDFLIQNGDRHHYETREDRVLLMDNGKGFGNAYRDHFDILAPLYQCCMIRKTTWDRLVIFSGGALTETLEALNQYDLLHPLLTKDHYHGLERRLLLIYATVELCREKCGSKMFK